MGTKTTEFIITRDNLVKGLDRCLTDYKLAALINKNNQWLYDYVSNTNQISLDYHPTVLPPKKFFFPQEETILEYTADGKIEAKIESGPLVLFGIRPCDLNGFKMLHEAFADDHGDPNFLAKIEKTIVIGMDCKKTCDQDSFCFKVNSHNASTGYDLMLYENNNHYAVETASEKGHNFLKTYFATNQANGNEISEFQKQKENNFKEKPFKNLEKFPEIFEKNKHHAVWEQEGSRCLSCGSCIMVCPTCYCFDVKDNWQLNLKEGTRKRKWDACMLSSFATISSGENFRHSATARLHHRINRKFNFLMTKHKQAVCVGCGRCVRACLAKISPKTIAEAITGEKS